MDDPGAPVSAVQWLAMPLIALAVVGLLAVLLRWTYANRRLPRSEPRAGEQGLLVPVVTATSRAEADRMIERLHAAGIQATSTGNSQRPLVLVWPQDSRGARDVLSSSG